jgi:hypothetical protein
VPVSEIGVSKTVIREIGERDTIAETQQWLRKLNADAGDVPPDFAMTRVLERWADGSREGQKMGVLALVRLDERGHHGLAAALDQLWQVRAKDPRDFRRLTEWARARVLVNPTPAGERGCTCDLSLSVRSHVHREPQDEEEEREPTPEEVAAYRRSKLIAEELEKLQIREEAKQLLHPREPLRVLRGSTFLTEGAELTYLVRRFLYETSTSKIYGPPGGGKTNFALDIALCAATGTEWHGVKIERCRVHFVMAEGEPVNRLRVAAFLHRHGLKPEVLDGWFTAIPQGVLLTPRGVADYLAVVREDRPGLVFLDTKNAMMDGDENSASDVAVMIRSMREIRDLGERCCVALIDHTGIADESRGRGSNAVMAAMDTEIRVSKQQVGDTAVYTAQVTRDKAAAESDPATFNFTLWPQAGVERPDGVAAPPVVNTEDEVIKGLVRETGPRAEDVEPIEVPSDVTGYRGEGHHHIVAMAEICIRHGRGETGVSRAEATAFYKTIYPKVPPKTARMQAHRAWDALVRIGRLETVKEGSTVLTGPSLWVRNVSVHSGHEE